MEKCQLKWKELISSGKKKGKKGKLALKQSIDWNKTRNPGKLQA